MAEISGFNPNFQINGKYISFKDMDQNKDGVVSEEEYNAVLKDMQADSVDITSSVDEADKTADEDTNARFEQEVKMEEALDNIKKQISVDFCGENSKYIADIAFDLKDYLEEFKTSYTGDISKMAVAFEEALPVKYEELKASYLSSDPQNVKSQVLDGIIEGLAGIFDEQKLQTLGEILEAETDKFMADYNGENLEADLKEHLEEYMKSDYEKLEGSISEYQEFVDSLATYIDSGEFEQLKDEAKKLLQEALDKGITLESSGIAITDSTSLENFIAGMNDAQELKESMENLIQSLSKETLLEKISAGKVADDSVVEEAPAETEEISYDIYQVNPESITDNFSKKVFTSANDMKKELLRDTIKNQLKLQITEQMAAKGLSFSNIEAVFNNTYNESVNEYVDNLVANSCTNKGSIISGLINSITLNKNKNLNDFIQLFNDNMIKNLEEMNQSNTDFDIQNIDMTTPGAINIEIGSRLRTKIGFRKFKPQVEAEAQKMCQANNVTYDSTIFNQIYEKVVDSDFNGVEEFLINFKAEYSNWVYSNKPASTADNAENTDSNDTTDLSIYQVNPDSIAALKNGKDVLGEEGVVVILKDVIIVNQFKSQIMDQMAAQGLSFNDIETVFNNVYNDSVNEYVGTMNFRRIIPNLASSGTIGHINMQDFIQIFNNNMAKTIEEINKSDTDFDIQNINYSGSKASSIKSGHWGNHIILNGVRASVEAEARRMCQANNVTYDNDVFNQIYWGTEENTDYNGLKEFLINFKTEYSIWVYDQKTE